MDIIESMLQYVAVINHKCFILSNDAAEQRNVDLQVFREGVDVAHGSEIHHAVGGLLTVLYRYTAYKETVNVGKSFFASVILTLNVLVICMHVCFTCGSQLYRCVRNDRLDVRHL